MCHKLPQHDLHVDIFESANSVCTTHFQKQETQLSRPHAKETEANHMCLGECRMRFRCSCSCRRTTRLVCSSECFVRCVCSDLYSGQHARHVQRRVQGLGFGVWGSEFWVWGLGTRVFLVVRPNPILHFAPFLSTHFSHVCSPYSKMGHFCPSSPLCL